MKLPFLFSFLFFSLFLSSTVWSITGLEVMQKMDESNKGVVGSTSAMIMTLIDAHENQVERELQAKTIENISEGDKSIMEFLRPLDVKGTKLLTWTRKDEDNKQWLYLPQFKRVKKINASNQSGSFMGSEFSFEDIAGAEIDKYDYELLEDAEDYWKVESKPKKNSGYSKIITTISKKFINPTSAQYFDRRGELMKVSQLSGYKPHSVGGKTFHLAEKIRMDNVQTKKASIIEWQERKLGIKHRENDFKSNKMK